MKKIFYIFACGLLGLLVSTILHGLIEILALGIIFGQPEKFIETIWWQKWSVIHDGISYLLWVSGVGGGIILGLKWWEPYGRQPGFHHLRKVFSRN